MIETRLYAVLPTFITWNLRKFALQALMLFGISSRWAEASGFWFGT